MSKNYSRNFILLCTIGCLTALKAQNGPITFESGEPGATWTWTAFENGLNTAPTTISNPGLIDKMEARNRYNAHWA